MAGHLIPTSKILDLGFYCIYNLKSLLEYILGMSFFNIWLHLLSFSVSVSSQVHPSLFSPFALHAISCDAWWNNAGKSLAEQTMISCPIPEPLKRMYSVEVGYSSGRINLSVSVYDTE